MARSFGAKGAAKRTPALLRVFYFGVQMFCPLRVPDIRWFGFVWGFVRGFDALCRISGEPLTCKPTQVIQNPVDEG